MEARSRPRVLFTLIVPPKVIDHPYAEAVKDPQIMGREVMQTVRPEDLAPTCLPSGYRWIPAEVAEVCDAVKGTRRLAATSAPCGCIKPSIVT